MQRAGVHCCLKRRAPYLKCKNTLFIRSPGLEPVPLIIRIILRTAQAQDSGISLIVCSYIWYQSTSGLVW